MGCASLYHVIWVIQSRGVVVMHKRVLLLCVVLVHFQILVPTARAVASGTGTVQDLGSLQQGVGKYVQVSWQAWSCLVAAHHIDQ